MIKALLVSCLILSFSAIAAEVAVMEVDVVRLRSSDELNTRILVDSSTGEGSVELKVQRRHVRHVRHHGGGNETVTTILRKSAKVEGLYLEGDKLIFHGVECGTYGVSRIFRIPTLYLSGKCDTSVRRSIVNGNNIVKVKFVTR